MMIESPPCKTCRRVSVLEMLRFDGRALALYHRALGEWNRYLLLQVQCRRPKCTLSSRTSGW
eukprot:2234121-Amphidinium_carterae.1